MFIEGTIPMPYVPSQQTSVVEELPLAAANGIVNALFLGAGTWALIGIAALCL